MTLTERNLTYWDNLISVNIGNDILLDADLDNITIQAIRLPNLGPEEPDYAKQRGGEDVHGCRQIFFADRRYRNELRLKSPFLGEWSRVRMVYLAGIVSENTTLTHENVHLYMKTLKRSIHTYLYKHNRGPSAFTTAWNLVDLFELTLTNTMRDEKCLTQE
jgi:hypothetical protein